jgi:uncharacterized membrane protein YgaE (UPF0421/DUF939 family)
VHIGAAVGAAFAVVMLTLVGSVYWSMYSVRVHPLATARFGRRPPPGCT